MTPPTTPTTKLRLYLLLLAVLHTVGPQHEHVVIMVDIPTLTILYKAHNFPHAPISSLVTYLDTSYLCHEMRGAPRFHGSHVLAPATLDNLSQLSLSVLHTPCPWKHACVQYSARMVSTEGKHGSAKKISRKRNGTFGMSFCNRVNMRCVPCRSQQCCAMGVPL